MKKIATHVVAIVIGILLAFGLRNPRVEVVHHTKEVPVIKEVEVVKVITKTKVKIVKEPVVADPVVVWKAVYHYSYFNANSGHLVQLLAGVAPTGLKSSPIPGGHRVRTKSGLALGLGYHYRILDSVQLGAQVLTNGTVLGSYGISF